MRFILLISLFAAALRADPITVTETKSGSGGTINLTYLYDVSGFPGPLTASIEGNVSCPGGVALCGDQILSGSIDLTMDLYSAGPVRNGVALLQLVLDSDGSAGGGVGVSGSIGPYSLASCPKGVTCQTSGFFPFELGVPFVIDLSGLANANPEFLGDGEFSAFASLQLFEVPQQDGGPTGAAVQIGLVPEPSSASLAVTGLFALFGLTFMRRKTSPTKIQ